MKHSAVILKRDFLALVREQCTSNVEKDEIDCNTQSEGTAPANDRVWKCDKQNGSHHGVGLSKFVVRWHFKDFEKLCFSLSQLKRKYRDISGVAKRWNEKYSPGIDLSKQEYIIMPFVLDIEANNYLNACIRTKKKTRDTCQASHEGGTMMMKCKKEKLIDIDEQKEEYEREGQIEITGAWIVIYSHDLYTIATFAVW